MVVDLEPSRPNQTQPDQTRPNLPDLLSWPTWATKPPDIPTHLTYPPICLAHLLDLSTHSDNLPELTDNLPEPTDNLPEPKDNLSQYRQHKFYKFHNVDQI